MMGDVLETKAESCHGNHSPIGALPWQRSLLRHFRDVEGKGSVVVC